MQAGDSEYVGDRAGLQPGRPESWNSKVPPSVLPLKGSVKGGLEFLVG